jgi:4'-phosphopantetheinyl transferase
MSVITAIDDFVRALQRPGPAGQGSREVYLWTVALEASDGQVEECRAWLSEEEVSRATRYKFDRHRRDFVLSRGVLRALLGKLKQEHPVNISFSYASHGKPALQDLADPVRFNMSRSSSMAAYAFTIGCEVGVDVEQIAPVPELTEVAARFFAAEETAELMALSELSRVHGFFNCWTRKEAVVKALGEGLSIPLDSFRVTLRPGEPARLLCMADNVQAAKHWTLYDWAPATEWVCALAYPDRPRAVRHSPMVSAGKLLKLL